MKKLAAIILGAVVLRAFPSQAAAPDFSSYFAVDLTKPLPSYAELFEQYGQSSNYDRRYDFYWDIGRQFDRIFAQTIISYGSSGKRLKYEGEDQLLAMIQSLPKQYYPYIGPYLHTVPNMSPKILNLPGIKETKNKFPERIAPQLKDVSNLEFLSPYLYYLLIPEIWPGNPQEYIRVKTTYPKVSYNPDFFKKVRDAVKPENFYPSVSDKPRPTTYDDLRTVEPTLSSPLTSADVKAFTDTIPAVNQFAAGLERQVALVRSRQLIDAYEFSKGQALPLNTLKDLVNPCQRLAQRIQVLGLENEFTAIIGPQGFTLAEWAYTCDKTIKAYRVSKMSQSTAAAILNYKDNIYGDYIRSLPYILRGGQVATIMSLLEMYKAPLNDVRAVRKNRRVLEQALKAGDYTIAGAPIAVMP